MVHCRFIIFYLRLFLYCRVSVVTNTCVTVCIQELTHSSTIFNFYCTRYGDLCPQTQAGKIFTCLFGLTGIALLGAAVATIGSRLVQAEMEAAAIARRQSRKRLIQVYEKMPKVIRNVRKATHKEEKKTLMEARKLLQSMPHPHLPKPLTRIWKATRWVLQSLALVAFGGLVIGKLEGWSMFDSIYYAMITGK